MSETAAAPALFGLKAPTRLTWRHYLLLAILAFAFFLPGQSGLPAMDRDESRYAEATTQMLQTGNFVDVRFQDQPRYLQPAGIYWLQAASVSLFSSPQARAIWAYRIPSLLSAVVAVLLTAAVGESLFGAAAGLGAGVLMAMSLMLGFESHLAKIDATLCATTLVAQLALMRIYLAPVATRHSRGWAALLWAALGWGLLLKGPLILLVSGGTIAILAALDRNRGWLRRLHAGWGAPLMIAIALPWFVAIGIVSDGAFFQHAVGRNFIGKMGHAQQSHGAPPGYYLVFFNLTFWPGSILAILAIPFAWARRKTPQVRFLLAWIIPSWLVFELIATKLPHYLLPVYPAVACLAAAAAFTQPSWGLNRVGRWLVAAYAVIWILIAAVLIVGGPLLMAKIQGVVDALSITVGVVAAVLLVVGLWFVWKRAPARAVALFGAATLLLSADAYGHVFPGLHELFMSPRIAAAVAKAKPCPDSVLATSPYREPSLVFLVGRETKLLNPIDAADYLANNQQCGLALIGGKEQPEFLARLAADGATPRPVAEIAGRNYSLGKGMNLTLYETDRARR